MKTLTDFAPIEQAVLALAKLDGRLVHSPAAEIWFARARIEGAVTAARSAGIPISAKDLLEWISGRTPPPRHSEGLNDPLSVAALFHLALATTERDKSPVARATLHALRTLLDDRNEAEVWGGEDLVRFGPAWREIGQRASRPFPSPTLAAIAGRMLEMRQSSNIRNGQVPTISSVDGRLFSLPPASASTTWLLGLHLPVMLRSAGLIEHGLPCFTDLPRYLPDDEAVLAIEVARRIARIATANLDALAQMERTLASAETRLAITSRSRAPTLLRLELCYPGITARGAARLLNISPQGATKLLVQVHEALKPPKTTVS
ncbi:hypothetical protein [Flavisphingomonas formosensis]|uniref:hypothetical protein n=1 Tax=Flavisphingomonas formosensis TaxID=861534 RepID=UPI0012F83CF7|nr:hypothetical protein [Sphingomonas formosensis]